jgi:dTMP kinase
MTAQRGRFIVLEGGEGAGKSTQAARLAAWLEEQGKQVVRTREPGGTEGAEAIRGLFLTGARDRWDPLTELLLVMAARRDHVQRKIAPALAAGQWVVCDRFVLSTMVYQGVAQGVPLDLIKSLQDTATDGLWPDLTLVFDIDPKSGLQRTQQRAEAQTRFEAHDLAFHQRLRDGFVGLAGQLPNAVVIDAALGVDAVAERVEAALLPLLAA